MADTVADVAPHVPVRDLDTLRRHFPGLDDDALAERLIRNAARATAGIGAAGGGVAAVEWAVAPTLLSAPVLLAAETVAVVAIELKLIGELHEVYGQPLPGGADQRAVALIQAWASQRGVNPMVPGVGVARCSAPPPARNCGTRLLQPLRPQPDHAGAVAHRRGGRQLPQPAGHPGARRAAPARDLRRKQRRRAARPAGPAPPTGA